MIDVTMRQKQKEQQLHRYRAWRLLATYYLVCDRLQYGVTHHPDLVVPCHSTLLDLRIIGPHLTWRDFVAQRARILRRLRREGGEP